MRRWMSPLLVATLLLPGLLSTGAVLAREGTPVPDATPEADTVHGINIEDMDLGVSPAADFNQFANGGWLARTTIPANRGSFGNFTALGDLTRDQLLGILDQQSKGTVDPVSDTGKALAFFAQGMDMDQRNAEGIAPIQPILDEIDKIDSLAAMNTFLESATFKGVTNFTPLGVSGDLSDSSMNAIYMGGPSLGLPNRDYYLDDSIGTPEVRQAYKDATAQLLAFDGYSPDAAKATAEKVYEFEKALAEPTLTREQEQDPRLSNNPMSIDEIRTLFPGMNWEAYLSDLGLAGQNRIIVTDKGYLTALPAILEKTDLDTLKAYLKLSVLWNFSNNLSADMEKVVFNYVSKALSGQEEQSPLNERVLGQVNSLMPDAIGQLYVAEYFPPAAKAEMETLTSDIISAFHDRLAANTWLTPATRDIALDKLSKLRVKVGYPDKWKDYSAVEIQPNYAMTALNASNAEARRNFAKAGKPVDRDEWGMPPQTVNAYYNPLNNEIVFPAAILQAPFFDLDADAPSNYGAIGVIIGHEITHGFDLQGSKFDANGNLHDWWTPEDTAAFEALNDKLAKQYDAIEVAPGLHVDGQLTVTENTADLGGIQVAYAALQRRLTRDPDAATPVAGEVSLPANDIAATPVVEAAGATPVAGLVLPPFTPAQRFFIASANNWRELVRPESLATQIHTDPHAPAGVRAVQPARNTDAFFEAFPIAPGDPEYLAPADRIVIW